MKLINLTNYKKAQAFHKSGLDVIANIYLRSAYGVI